MSPVSARGRRLHTLLELVRLDGPAQAEEDLGHEPLHHGDGHRVAYDLAHLAMAHHLLPTFQPRWLHALQQHELVHVEWPVTPHRPVSLIAASGRRQARADVHHHLPVAGAQLCNDVALHVLNPIHDRLEVLALGVAERLEERGRADLIIQDVLQCLDLAHRGRPEKGHAERLALQADDEQPLTVLRNPAMRRGLHHLPMHLVQRLPLLVRQGPRELDDVAKLIREVQEALHILEDEGVGLLRRDHLQACKT